ncbi:hypothetical protein HMN09_01234200 [Mycena chlorophos]|uniref:Uncharacterized protein n=1 Tax=Mycena chlorophos TaxID=658473 RepID=A0A8H6S483_MYCCL|nr:hypothetical protein HMN09_01234200 [Mycena chlorophos]
MSPVNNENQHPSGQRPSGQRVSRYYRNDQNGWSVRPAAALPAGNDVPPPPYTAAAAPGAAAQQPPIVPMEVDPPADQQGNPLPFDVPLNTNLIDGQAALRTLFFHRGTPFNVGLNEICQVMGLHPAVAQLGYKWDNSRVSALPCPGYLGRLG